MTGTANTGPLIMTVTFMMLVLLWHAFPRPWRRRRPSLRPYDWQRDGR